MRGLILADLIRLRRTRAFHLALLGMLVLAALFMIMQATAMDYKVPLSRVIFLPVSMYGITSAAFVSVFIGTDYSDGFIRNKLIVLNKRKYFFLSQIGICSLACVIIYVAITIFTTLVGSLFFENNVQLTEFCEYFFLGICMSITTGCIFSLISIINGNKAHSIILCMGMASGMLFLALHTNSILVQEEYKDGILNSHYISGIKRVVYEILHDINPCGQAAQLSTWEVLHPWRIALFNVIFVLFLLIAGCNLFERKDIY